MLFASALKGWFRMMRWLMLLAATTVTACTGNLGKSGMFSAAQPYAVGTTAGSVQQAALPMAGIRRLTQVQYANSIQDLLGSDITVTVPLDADQPLDYLVSLGAGSVTTTAEGAQLYISAAATLAAQRFVDPNAATAFVGCTPASLVGTQDACVQKFVSGFGRRAWRRPLTDTETGAYVGLYTTVAQDANSSAQGLQTLTAALLSSPYFIYRPELGVTQASGVRDLDDYELASRLAYLLWNSTPDAELLQAASLGQLGDTNGLITQATRLLASPRASVAMTQFFEQWLGFDGLDALSKDANVYPLATATVGTAMQQEFDHVVQGLVFNANSNFMTLMTTHDTWVNTELANLYGLPTVNGNGFVATQQPQAGPRGGLLTMAGFLAAQAKPNATAPVTRGHYVVSRLMCQVIPAPPADVPALPGVGSSEATATMRQRLALHVADPTCASCHDIMDPPGLALEQFDGIGVYRTTDNGVTIDVSGTLDQTSYVGAAALGQLLQSNTSVQTCVVQELFRQSIGQVEQSAWMPAITTLTNQFADSGFSYRTLVMNLVSSDLFRKTGALR